MYSVNELCELSGISKASFYRLRKELPEFAAILEKHKSKNGKTDVYAVPVLEWLKEYKHNTSSPAAPETHETPTNSPTISETEALIKAYAEQINLLQAENERLRNELSASADERRELIAQAGKWQILLNTEQQKTAMLLSAPQPIEPQQQQELETTPEPQQPTEKPSFLKYILAYFKKQT